MKTTAKIIILCSLCTLVFGCQKDDENPLPTNNAPTTPKNPTPADAASDISLTQVLSWSCSDPEGDSTTYELYFSTINPPNTLIAGNLKTASYAVSDLDSNKTYYWRVNAKDAKGAASAGPIWRFTTVKNTMPVLGLIAYYPFNGNANDESGNGINGSVNGATLTTDRFGNSNKAYSFNGVNDYISIPNGINLSNSSFTISFWSKCNVLGIYYNCAIGQGLSSVKNQQLHIAYRDVAMQYRFTFDFYDNGINVPSQYSDLLLHNWTCSYDANSKSRKIYRDAVLVGSDVSSSDYQGSGPFLIGTGTIGSTSAFNGTIDDVRIYSRALTELEVQQIYHEGGWK